MGGAEIEYCYDCGSNNLDPLHAEVKRYGEAAKTGYQRMIDVLFVSHLDSDHVNGLDELLNLCDVDTVVMPYLSDFERLFTLSETIDDGEVTAEAISLLGNPVAWFAGRGAKRIVMVRGDGDQSPGANLPDNPPDFPPPSRRGHTADEALYLDKLKVDFDRLKDLKSDDLSTDECEVYVINHQEVLSLIDQSGEMVNWCFITYVNPEPVKETRFRNAVQTAFASEISSLKIGQQSNISSLLVAIAKDKVKRDRLKGCYREIASNLNLTSLSLYSGPLWLPPKRKITHKRYFKGYNTKREKTCNACGWLGTGDSDLKSPDRREHFLYHYARILSQVLTLAIPHHGSEKNFHETILPMNCIYGTVSSRSGNIYHPAVSVKTSTERRGQDLIHTTEQPDSMFLEEIKIV